MHTLKRNAAKALLVVMVANSCPVAQAVDWKDCLDYMNDKQKQFSKQIKKHKGATSLMGVAAATALCYLYLRKQVNEMVEGPNKLLKDVGIKYNLDVEMPNIRHVDSGILKEDRKHLKDSIDHLRQQSWIYQCFGAYRDTVEQLEGKESALERFEEKVDYAKRLL